MSGASSRPAEQSRILLTHTVLAKGEKRRPQQPRRLAATVITSVGCDGHGMWRRIALRATTRCWNVRQIPAKVF